MPSTTGAVPTEITIDCSSTEVAAILGEIVEVVSGHGARFSPGLVILERNGELSGHIDDSSTTADSSIPLVVLPREVMPRTKAGVWSFEGESLAVAVDPAADPLTRRLLGLMARLYSVTGKPRWYQTMHPKAALSDSSISVRAIRRLRPGFSTDPSAEGFIRTRHYAADEEMESVLLPVADVLNHDRQGARLRFINDALVVARRHPTGTSECFVNYGGIRRDPLELALHYGFADAQGRVARSAPTEVSVAGVGQVQVGLIAGSPRILADPPIVTPTPGGLRLSHLTFQSRDIERTETPIRMVLQSMGVGPANLIAQDLLRNVATANIDLVNQLNDTLDHATPVGAMLSEACNYQVRVFEEFVSGLG